MKQRVISGVFIALITIASVLVGGYLTDAICLFIMIWGCKEINAMFRKKFNIAVYLVMLISCLIIYFFVGEASLVILLEPLLLAGIAVFDEKTSFADVCVVYFMSIMIGFGCFFIRSVESYNKFLHGYIILITYLTDVFALFAGRMFGKHKLNERVSPKKTVEGFIGGWLVGGVVSFVWAMIFKFFGFSALEMLLFSFTLPILSQIGDLIFSLIKRYYDIKDFSNLIPGHGGILDRLDSTLTTMLFFGALSSLIL